MPGLGPRVGGAHVETNLQFNEASIGVVGRKIERQLSSLADTLAQVGERNGEIYRAIGKDSVIAWRSLLGAVVSGSPLMGSAISAVAGSATLLAGSFYSAAQASYAFAPALAAVGVAAGAARIGMDGFFEAISSGEMDDLTPSARSAAQAVRGLSDEWERLRRTVQERLFAGLSDDIERLGTTLLPVMERGLGKMADALNGLFESVLKYLGSADGLKQINRFLNNSADIFGRLSKAAVPTLDGILKLLNALAPSGKRMADRIAEIAESFQRWASAPDFAERIDQMMRRAEKTAGLLFDVIRNLGSAISNVFEAANPATNRFLEMLVQLTQRFEGWTSSVEGQDAIAKWANSAVDVMEQFGKTLEAVFKVTEELADPRVIISFLKTVEGAFEILGKLPLDKIVSAFATLAEVLQPVSSLFLAIVIAGTAVNILLGTLIGQFGGLFRIITKLVKFRILINVLRGFSGGASAAGTAAAGAAAKTSLLSRALAFLSRVYDKIKSAISSVASVFTKTSSATSSAASSAGRLSKAFGPVLSILGRLAKFAGPVGIVIWIGTVIAKSEELQQKLGEVWDSLKEVGSAIAGAFEEIGKALEPLAPVAEGAGKAIGKLFEGLDFLMEMGIAEFLDRMSRGFSSLAVAIEGVGKVVAGIINIIMGLLTLDFGKVTEGFQQLVSGIGPLIEGLFGAFTSFFQPANLVRLGSEAIAGLGSGISSGIPNVLSSIGGLVGGIVRFITSLPGRLLTLGSRAIGFLVRGISSGIPKVLASAGRLVSGVVGWIGRLPGRLLQLGARAVTLLAGAVGAGIGRLTGIAARIVTGIVSKIIALPGRLLQLGLQAISRLAGAFSTGISRMRGIAENIKNTVLNVIRSIPGQMLSIGASIIGNLVSGLTSRLGDLAGVAGKIGGIIKGVLPGSPVQDGPLRAWNHGSGASGGGRNVIDAITAGLRDTEPIRKAMREVSDAVSNSLAPQVGIPQVAGSSSVTRSMSISIQNPAPETASDSLTRTTRNLAYLGLA